MYLIVLLEFIVLMCFAVFLFSFFKKKIEKWLRDIIHDEVFDVIHQMKEDNL